MEAEANIRQLKEPKTSRGFLADAEEIKFRSHNKRCQDCGAKLRLSQKGNKCSPCQEGKWVGTGQRPERPTI